MLKQIKYFRVIAIFLSFVLVLPSAIAKEGEICEPFKNAKIDQSLIETMLDAANKDNLYQIVSSSSKMGFCVDSKLGRVEGSFDTFQGGVAMQGTSSQAMVSINVGSLKTNVFLIDEMLKGDKFFDVEDHPELIFVSTGLEWLSETRAVLTGNLSMHGVTKVVAFYVEFTEIDGELSDSDTILVKATTTIQRSEFGMSTMSSMVSDKVNLCMSIEAERYRVG